MEKQDLEVELGVEEIPASIIQDAALQFSDNLIQSLKDQRLSSKPNAVWYTPRRIIVGLGDIPIAQDNLVEVITGPPKSVAYDASGRPAKAALAFAQKNRVPLSRIKIIQTPKGEYLALERKVRGKRTLKLLETIIPSAIANIQFAKTMQWSADHFRFSRPLRWILALYGGRLVRFRVADVTSANYTVGHRFLGKSRIVVSSLNTLKQRLQENAVLVDPEERLSAIKLGLNREAKLSGGHPIDDPDLLKTVVNLNEYPSVICGAFEARFLNLPEEILITVMREHQKYFSVLDDRGRLLPIFLAVVNLQSDNQELIRAGHERVLRARLADAAFFWDMDRRTRLADRESALKSVLFQDKLGSYYDKTQRVLRLLPKVAQILDHSDLAGDLEAAAHVFKCDLVAEMVKEFADLQGIVGGLYAKAEGYPDNVWQAIYQQYLPKTSSSPSPSTLSGALLALVDRVDTVCGCFSVGLAPSGSGDPFAIRRQGNGILKIILDHRMSISIEQLIHWSLDTYGLSSEQTANEIKEFFEGRLRFLFEEMNYAYDFINAALAAGWDNPLDVFERLRALQGMREESDFLSLVSNFKRIINILAQVENVESSLNEAMLRDPAENALWERYLQIQPQVDAARQRKDYSTVLHSLASMRHVIDDFFDSVMVMTEDPATRINRISLLRQVSRLFQSIGDISRIVIERGVK